MTMYPQQPPPPPAKRRNPKWLVITFLIIMFGCATIGIISCLGAVNAEN